MGPGSSNSIRPYENEWWFSLADSDIGMSLQGVNHSGRWDCEINRAMRRFCLPYLEDLVQDGITDRRQEDGKTSLVEVARNGRVQLPAAAALGLRQLQELHGPLEGLGREEQAHAVVLWLDGRQPLDGVDRHEIVNGHGCPRRQGDTPC